GGDGLALPLAPLALAVLWLRFQAYPKTNWGLLMAYLGLGFCVFILLAPPPPGYFPWSLPFLVSSCCRQDAGRFIPPHLSAPAGAGRPGRRQRRRQGPHRPAAGRRARAGPLPGDLRRRLPPLAARPRQLARLHAPRRAGQRPAPPGRRRRRHRRRRGRRQGPL